MQSKIIIVNNFICNRCGRKISLWEILKLSIEPEMKFICKCNNEIKFKENQVLKYLPALFAASIVFVRGNIYAYCIYFFIFLFLIFIYFATIKKVKSS